MSSSSHLHGRTLARCQALQLLFQAEACDRPVNDVLAGDYVLSDGPLDEYAEQVARGCGERILELDAVLAGAARNWAISRMSATDRNLLRISLYEILYVDEVDKAVSIDECVELAKAFGGSDESSRFVNGVLGRIAADIEAGVDVVEVARQRELAEAAELAAAAYGEEARVPSYGADAYDDAEGDDDSSEQGSAGEGDAAVSEAASSDDIPEWAREGE